MINLDTKSVSLACPISGSQRDNTIARLIALATLLLATTTRALIALEHFWPAAILMTLLTLDFAIRAFCRPRFSPLATGGRAISMSLGLRKELVDAAPKIFAARIGLLFALVTAIFLFAGFPAAAMVVVTILALCAFLECIFAFCLGCWMYNFLPTRLGNALARDFAV